jgi:hypothetical protein
VITRRDHATWSRDIHIIESTLYQYHLNLVSDSLSIDRQGYLQQTDVQFRSYTNNIILIISEIDEHNIITLYNTSFGLQNVFIDDTPDLTRSTLTFYRPE